MQKTMAHLKIPIPLVGRLDIEISADSIFTPWKEINKEKREQREMDELMGYREPIRQDYTFQQMKDMALKAAKWEPSIRFTYETKLNDRERLFLSPRARIIGTSEYETAHTRLNAWRNNFLVRYPIFGERQMLHIEVTSIGAQTGARAYTLDQQLIDLYEKIHANLKSAPNSAIFEVH